MIDSANLFKESEQFIRLKSHTTVTFSETNSAAATHQGFTYKPSAKQMILFAIKHSHSLADFTLKEPLLKWHHRSYCVIIDAYVARKDSQQIALSLGWKASCLKILSYSNFFLHKRRFDFFRMCSAIPENCFTDPRRTSDPSLRTTVANCYASYLNNVTRLFLINFEL